MKNDPVIEAARDAFKNRLRDSKDVSAHTRNAQAIAKAWRSSVSDIDPDRYLVESLVAPDLDQKFDIVDVERGCAYEFKVSGKNATGEFYKDIVKVIAWNERRKKKLSKLIFITEESWGKKYLDTPMPRLYITFLKKHEIEVEIVYLQYA